MLSFSPSTGNGMRMFIFQIHMSLMHMGALLLHTPRVPLLCESHSPDERHQGAQNYG